MWGRFKRKVSRPRDTECVVVDQPPGNVDADIVLTGFRKLSSTYNAADLAACSSSQRCLRDEDIMVKSAGPVFEETSSSCKCSPLMNFHKHLFGSLKGRQKASTTGKQISPKGIGSVRKSVIGNGDSVSDVSDEIINDGTPVHVNGLKEEDAGDGLVCSNCASTSTSDPDVIDSHVSNDAIWKEEVANPLPVPPRLMRREKSRNGNGEVVIESRKSRLSNRLRESSGCSVVMPKPQEPNPDLVGHCSSPNVERTGMGTADIISGLPPTIQPKSRDTLASGSSVSDYGRTSTEPSTAESTDSGIQPSLCSSNDDKGHSSPDDEDVRDSPRIASHADGPHSDYLLFEEARALSTRSSVVGQNSQDGLRVMSSAAAVMEADDVPPPIPEKRRNFGRMMNGIDLLRSDLPEVLSAMARQTEHIEPDYVHTSRRGEVDYVPVDGSLSNIYNEEVPMWDAGDKYASVPKTERQDDTLVASEHADWSCDVAKEHDWTLTDGAALHDYTTFAACSQDNAFESSGCTDGCHRNAHTAVEAELDSDDGEYLPPLPTRNYLNADSLSCLDPAFAPLSQSELSGPSSSAVVDDEKTHMSWDEVMKEAQVLGIPLSAPKSDTPDWRSSTSIASSDTSDCADNFRVHNHNRMSCSEHGAFPPSCRNDYPEIFHQGSPSKTVNSPKAMSPFKDKFRLQNLFSKKKKKGDVVDGARPVQRHVSAAAEIQRRNLPPLPPKRGTSEVGPATTSGVLVRSSLDHIPGSSDSPRQRAHRTVSTLTLPSRESTSMLMSGSVWAGSSASVASHGAMSVGGISTGSVMSIELNQNRGDGLHGACSEISSGCSNVDFIQSFSKLRDCGWYWGPLGWEEAEMKLADKPDGSFLVRDSSDDRYILSLSFRSQGVTHHTRIEHYKGQFSFYSQPKSHGAASIVDFMERAMAYSRSGQFLYFLRPNAPGHAPAPVQLLHPVSRLNTVPSLQHLCRFVIAGCVRRDLIDLLPTPPSLKEYLKQTQYYAMT